MSEEEESLNIKRPSKRARAEHSTPKEVLTFPQNTWEAYPERQKTRFAEQTLQPKEQRSMHLLQGLLSSSREFSSDYQLSFPRRRLSTIPGSEESTETLHQTVSPPETPVEKTGDSEGSHRKSRKLATDPWTPGFKKRPSYRASKEKIKIKRQFKKQLVEERVRAWELRQLIDIEEATTHELVIEEVRTWK